MGKRRKRARQLRREEQLRRENNAGMRRCEKAMAWQREISTRLAEPFEAGEDQPEWYHEMARLMRSSSLFRYSYFLQGQPSPEQFDSTLSELGDDEHLPASIRSKRSYHEWDDFDEKVAHDLYSDMDIYRKEWRFHLYQGWRTTFKKLLGPQGVKNMIDSKRLPRWFWNYRRSATDTEVSVWSRLADDISECNDECRCLDGDIDDCTVHMYLAPTLNEVHESLRSLFLKRHRQREQRKLEVRYGGLGWWQSHLNLTGVHLRI